MWSSDGAPFAGSLQNCLIRRSGERERVEVWQLGNRRLRVLSGLCTRELNDLWSGHPVFWPDLWCSFLMMSGGHHVTLALPPCIAWATEQETMSAQIPRLLLSRQRSLRLAVISILLVGRPPDFHRASAAAVASSTLEPAMWGFLRSRKKLARRHRTAYAGLPFETFERIWRSRAPLLSLGCRDP